MRMLNRAGLLGLAGVGALLVAQGAQAQEARAQEAGTQEVGAPPAALVKPAMNLEQTTPPPGAPHLTVTNALGHVAHLFPTASQRQKAGTVHNTLYFGEDPPLFYHSGGPVMQPNVLIYNIFWAPSTLQSGIAGNLPAPYRALMNRLAIDYMAQGLANITTQYFQTISGVTKYIRNGGGFGGWYADTTAYPASDCTDTATPGNCIIDTDIQTAVTRAMTAKGWTGGLNKIFVVHTDAGEGSCFDNSSSSCAYTEYCAYHSFFSTASGTPVIYANIPYGNTTNCQLPGEPSPNNNAAADAALSAMSHEVTEAITDPELNAWFTNAGWEIGDLCAYDFGRPLSYAGGKANQLWNGHPYLLQSEFDNHAFSIGPGCAYVGPANTAPDNGS